MCESIGIEPAAAVVEPVVGGDAPEAPSHTRGVCVFVSSSSSSFVVVVVGGGGRVARRASRAARPHEEQRRAGAGCCELQQRGPNRAPPTAHKVRPPDAPAARQTAGWGCGRIPKRAAHLVDCKAASWERGRRIRVARPIVRTRVEIAGLTIQIPRSNYPNPLGGSIIPESAVTVPSKLIFPKNHRN